MFITYYKLMFVVVQAYDLVSFFNVLDLSILAYSLERLFYI